MSRLRATAADAPPPPARSSPHRFVHIARALDRSASRTLLRRERAVFITRDLDLSGCDMRAKTRLLLKDRRPHCTTRAYRRGANPHEDLENILARARLRPKF